MLVFECIQVSILVLHRPCLSTASFSLHFLEYFRSLLSQKPVVREVRFVQVNLILSFHTSLKAALYHQTLCFRNWLMAITPPTCIIQRIEVSKCFHLRHLNHLRLLLWGLLRNVCWESFKELRSVYLICMGCGFYLLKGNWSHFQELIRND